MTDDEIAQARTVATQIGTIAIVKALIALVCVDDDPAAFRSNLLLLDRQASRTLEGDAVLKDLPDPVKTFVKESALAFVAETIAATVP